MDMLVARKVHSLKLTDIAPENRPKRPKRKFIFQPWDMYGICEFSGRVLGCPAGT